MKKLNRTTTNTHSDRPVKVLQFGEGNFLRGFADWMIHIMNEKTSFNGDVQIIQPLAKGMETAINRQEGLYHVILQGLQNGHKTRDIRLITCVKGVINPYTHPREYLEQAANPHLEFIISNTTEAGIHFNEQDITPDILPDSFPGKLAIFLYRRFNVFKGDGHGLTIIPCELIDKNGIRLREAVLRYTDLWQWPHEFTKWLDTNVTFCNALVDRIVPGFPSKTIKQVQTELGYDDNLVVTAEPFHLWVIEGPERLATHFPVQEAGLQVRFVNDITPYRERKVRVLNGAHTAMVPIGYLQGIKTVKETMEDPITGSFMQKVIFEEILPTLPQPEEELIPFANAVTERFKNPFIQHELISIALNAISKFKVRVLPSILAYQKEKGMLPRGLVRSLAHLLVFYRGHYKGQDIPLRDAPEILDFFTRVWQCDTIEKVVFKSLDNPTLWGRSLININGLQKTLVKEITVLLEQEHTTGTPA
ncbi:tagaturonate reductase [Ascidiimonas aurantiaca]|uniref:tagaturonate reductase n=1 Tax=Ascidiimonas aurantiaca TaxID=1685432 RepID=UPI0030EF7FD6